jgi:hypothetical protein
VSAVRISPATAKYKLPMQPAAHPESTTPGESTPTDAQSQTHPSPSSHNIYGQHASGQPGSVNATSTSSPSIPNFSSSSTLNEDGRNGQTGSRPTSAPVPSYQDQSLAAAQRYMVNEESWKHHAQARAILSNLIGPNGEQLSSSDPYNTTVFVGGLSPLISEETLRTFFIPFGEIHYVGTDIDRFGAALTHILGQGSSGQELRIRSVHPQAGRRAGDREDARVPHWR